MEIVDNPKGIEFAKTCIGDVIKHNDKYYICIEKATTNEWSCTPYYNVVNLENGNFDYINEKTFVLQCPHCKLVIE